MERLAFGEGSHYSALEASIHLCRYLTAKSLCEGRRVLDIACGEGYGSALMSSWGAASVTGVDVSAEAIERAKSSFATPNVRFVQASGEELQKVANGQKYDLIVSLETVEHVDDPTLFLSNLKALLADDGVIVLSCPNDNWYFADGGSNPYHKHRWSAEEFRRFSEAVLGPASWAYGTFGLGFVTYAERGTVRVLGSDAPQEAMVESPVVQGAIVTHMQEDSAASPADVAFFVGFWGAQAPDAIFAGYPVSMDLTKSMRLTRDDANAASRWAKEVEEALATRQQIIDTVRARLEEVEDAMANVGMSHRELADQLAISEREKRQSVMLYRVAQSEAELLRNQLGHHQYLVANLSSEADELRRNLGGAQEQIASTHVQLAASNEQLAQVNERLAQETGKLASANEHLALANQRLAGVPWRVVAVWYRLRRFIPAWALEGVLRGVRAVRGGARR